MSYNVISESPVPLDWDRVYSVVSAHQQRVEVFPIPAESPGERDALGISIPVDQADQKAWDELIRLLDALRGNFGMNAFELYSGLPFEASTLERIRMNYLG